MSNVIDFSKKKEKTESKKPVKKEKFDFEEIMKKNEENEKRKKEDRKKANKGVKRSYRLKKK